MIIALTNSVYPAIERLIRRRPVLLWGAIVFLHSLVACALADSIDTLVVARLLQAFGACAGTLFSYAAWQLGLRRWNPALHESCPGA